MKTKSMALALLLADVMFADTIYRFPPIRYVTRAEIHEQFLNDGKKVMDIKGIPDASETLVCTNWVCPTSIVVNAMRYCVIAREGRLGVYADIMTTNSPSAKKAHIEIYQDQNAKEARRSVFAGLVQSDVFLPRDFALIITAYNLDPMTNMMFVASSRDGGTNDQWVIYKNMTVSANAPTNAVDFAVAIINAGLPENERIAVTPEGE